LTRIEQTFEKLRQRNERALVAYIAAGDPSPRMTVELALALERGGADILELGVPFSDPIADGPVIQRASERALRQGTTLALVLQLVADLRRRSAMPVVIFSYLNPVLRYGFDRFAADAARAGADGALLTDLSIEEAAPFLESMLRQGLDPIFLVSQTTPDGRLRQLSQSSRGFVYLVSRAGVTGVQDRLSEQALELLARTRRVTNLPLAVGFGLSTREHMAALAPHADGAVVGSAFVRLIEQFGESRDLPDRLAGLAAQLKKGLVAAGQSGEQRR
jgi:tryptophan synthase alpha chain